MVAESMSEDPALTLNGAVKRIGPRVGVVPGTLRGWGKQAAIDAGQRPGVSILEASGVNELEREVKELKRANEILLAASSSFARELDPRCRGDRLRGRSSGPIRGRADMPRAVPAWCDDRSEHILRGQVQAPVCEIDRGQGDAG
jgi:transposase-like protein